MATIRVYELLRRRVLVTRESARAIERELTAALAHGENQVTLDFEGVEGIAPSFVDEVLAIVEQQVTGEMGSKEFRVEVSNSPTRLSTKFEALARGRGIDAVEASPGSWLLGRNLRETGGEAINSTE